MAVNQSGVEIEIKLAAGTPASVRRQIRSLGFRVSARRVFESNALFDFPAPAGGPGTLGLLRSRGELLRLRQLNRDFVITYKGATIAGKHRQRQEVEAATRGGAAVRVIFEKLGLVETFRYDKYRTEYRKRGEPGVVMLDETPMGTYLELEGPPAWIDRTAARLGRSESDYITASYARLWTDYLAARREPFRNMQFSRSRTVKK